MRILVAYGTKRVGNEGLARAVATGLAAAGHAVDVIAAAKVDALDRWDAVVVGGAPYAWFWERAARRFVKHNVEDLFQVQQPPLMLQLLTTLPPPELTSPGATPASVPEPEPEPEPELEAEPAAPLSAAVLPERGVPLLVHRLLLCSCLLTGVTALAAGVALLFSPLQGALVPALLLLGVVGGGSLLAALMEGRRSTRSEFAVCLAGSALTGWLLVDLLMLRTFSWLQGLYLLVGLGTVAGAAWLWRVRTR